jgi:hypothetical protein
MSKIAEKEGLLASNQCTLSSDPLVPTVFHEPWWLNAATRGAYEQVEVSEGSRVVGRLPFAVRKLPGRKISGLPTLTHVLGPAIAEAPGSINTKFLHRYSVTRELIAKLPKVDRFRQKLHRGDPEALGFQSAGFRTGLQLTFEVRANTEIDAWKGLRHKTRNVIRRLQNQLEVADLDDSDEFLGFYQSNLAARGREMFEPKAEVSAVCSAALQNRAGKILCVRDAQRRPVAAALIVFDAQAAYYLMSTRALNAPNGAVNLLIWRGICFCIERGLTFDFDGITKEGTIPLYAGFGGQPKPIYIVTRESKKVELVDSCRTIMSLFSGKTYFDR